MSDVLEQTKAEELEFPIPTWTTNAQIAELIIDAFRARAIRKLETDFELSATDRVISNDDAKEINRTLHDQNSGLFFVRQMTWGHWVERLFYTVWIILKSNWVQEA